LLGAVGFSLLAATVELARCPQFVAFVPSASTAQAISNQSAQLGDAVYSANPHQMLAPGAHAILAKAEMPAALLAKPFTNRARLKDLNAKAAAVEELRAQSSEPRLSESRSRSQRQLALAAKQSVSPTDNAPQQWIVFTAWEQTETPTPQAVSDYEPQATAGQVAGNSQPGANATTRPVQPSANRAVPVTRLIFRILPANPKSTQPGAVSFGEGWLVIQL
jgi:hypothetical protein